MGYVLAVVSSLFFSLYVIPRKLTQCHPLLFTFWVGVGFTSVATIVFVAHQLFGPAEQFSVVLWWGIVAGVLWGIGFLLFTVAIDRVGITRANQWKNLQGPVAVVLGMVVLSEATRVQPWYALAAAIAIFASAVALMVPDTALPASGWSRVGVALVSGVAFGCVSVINKYLTDNGFTYAQLWIWSLALAGFMAGAVVMRGQRRELAAMPGRDIRLGLLAGVLYFGASYFMLASYWYIPLAIGFSVIQLNGLWTILIGIIVFREVNYRHHWVRVSFGLACVLAGIAFLTLAKLG